MNRQKRFEKLFVSAKIFVKNLCPRSQRLRWHCASIVNDYVDTMSARSTTTLTTCQQSQRLRRHCVSVVNDYADTDKTTWTLSENFEGFSQILKEQSGEKKYLGVFTNPIAII